MGGSTGVSLSLVCAVKKYPLNIVTSDAFSQEKRNHMQFLGANLTLVPSDDGGMAEALTLEVIVVARELSSKAGSYWTDSSTMSIRSVVTFKWAKKSGPRQTVALPP